jgi:hypothetical protein
VRFFARFLAARKFRVLIRAACGESFAALEESLDDDQPARAIWAYLDAYRWLRGAHQLPHAG